LIAWTSFSIVVTIILFLDLGVFNKKSHQISSREAGRNTLVFFVLAMLMAFGVYFVYQNHLVSNPTLISPYEASLKFITGYFVEFALSIDNIFVIALLFSKFNVPGKFQHKVLFWGIIGAVVFRLLMILFGVSLINNFTWTIYLFGGFLIFSGIKILFEKEDIEDAESFLEKWIGKVLVIKKDVVSGKFFVKENGRNIATTLFLVLILVEFTDLIFALDSVPAIISITPDPFIVFTSNIMAILGLRSLYFFLAAMLDKFSYLKYSLVVILVFIGIKMLLSHTFHLPEWLSLAVVIGALVIGVILSLIKESRKPIT
jgi:tellurite resistance protein TerC